MAKKVKYMASLVIFVLMALAFIFSTVFRIASRNIPKVSAEVLSGYSYDAVEGVGTLTISPDDLTSGTDDTKIITEDGINSVCTNKGIQRSDINVVSIGASSFPYLIDENAFKDCSDLKKIDISGELVSIGASAFSNCSALKRIDFNCDADFNDITIGSSAFAGSNTAGAVYLNGSVVKTGETGSDICSKLTGAGIPKNWLDNPQVDSDSSAYTFDAATGTLTISENTETVTESEITNVCSNKEDIKKVIIKEDVKSIKSKAFNGCSKLVEIIFEGDKIPECDEDAFYGIPRTGFVFLNEKRITKNETTEAYNKLKNLLPETWFETKITANMFEIEDNCRMYNGNAQEVKFSIFPEVLKNYSLQYSKLNNAGTSLAYWGSWTNKKPSDKGNYRIKITAKNDPVFENSEVILTNALIISDLNVDMINLKYNTDNKGEKTLNILVLGTEPEDYTLTYSLDNGTTWSPDFPKDSETYKIKVSIGATTVSANGKASHDNKEFTFSYDNAHITDSDGYITDEHGLLKYKRKENNTYDVKGYVNGIWRQVTYDYKGFSAGIWPKSFDNKIQITSDIEFVSSGKGLLLKYNLKNTSGEAINNFRFWIAGDTMVSGNDHNINVIKDGTALLTGNGMSFFSFSSSQGGVAVPTYYNSYGNNIISYSNVINKEVGADPSTVSRVGENETPDSALVCYFPLSSLEPGQTSDYTMVFGTGDEEKAKEVAQEIKDDLGLVTVTVKNDKDDTISSINIQKGSKLEDVIKPDRPYSKLTFDGWYDDKELNNKKDDSFVINENLTLYFKWNKAEPKVEDFLFAAPENLTYNDEEKTASVTQNSDIEGMGKVTVKYYSDPECTKEVDPKNAGTYYIGISVDEGDNYLATTEILKKDDWKFEIGKAKGEIPKINGFSATYGQTLSDIPFPKSDTGSWAWEDGNTKINSTGTSEFTAIFTPNDKENYDWSEAGEGLDENGNIKVKVEVTVNKAKPTKDMFSVNPTEKTYNANAEDVNITCPEGLTKYSLQYSKDDGTNWSESKPLDAGNYKVKVVIKDDPNYEDAEIVLDNTFTVTKAAPKADLFSFTAPENLTYNGEEKTASVTQNSDIEGMGKVTVKYYSDPEYTKEVEPKNAGTYYIGISVDEGDNYSATTEVLKKDDWKFEITKVTPKADNFNVTLPASSAYDGNERQASAEFNTQGGKLSGMGDTTIKYSADGSTWSTEKTKNAGTYYVGIEVSEGTNYLATTEVLKKDDWKFEITKATPKADNFNVTLPESPVYDGNERQANAEFNTQGGKLSGMGDNITVYYSKKLGENNWGNWTTDAPKNAGEYKCGITVNEGNNYESIGIDNILTGDNWNFEITKAKGKVPEINDLLATYGQPLSDIPFPESDTGSWAWENKDTKIDSTGTSEFTAIFTPNDKENYDWSEAGEGLDENGNVKVKVEINIEIIAEAVEFSAEMFGLKGNSEEYNGEAKNVDITYPDSLNEQIAEYSLQYSKDGGTNWSESKPLDAGNYNVGIVIKNYNPIADFYRTFKIYLEDTFKVVKATPQADNFDVTLPKSSAYDGNERQASAEFNTQDDKLYGMGNITIKYSADGSTWNTERPKNTGTYYVGIEVSEGTNYLATTEVLKKNEWTFTIAKAIPDTDFTIIEGGTTGSEPVLLANEKKEIIYGTTLKDAKNLLPTSKLGTWNYKEPEYISNKVGDSYIELIFTPNDTENYDWSNIPGWNENTKTLDVKLLISTIADKADWGEEKDVGNGIKNYVSDDGTTSVEITGTDSIYWVKEESYDVDLGRVTSAWYGVDNSSGVFESGSRLCIRWINKVENPEEWGNYRKMMDITESQEHEWIFIAEVIHPDGKTKYTALPHPVPFYIQLGDDWDIEDVGAMFISENEDETVDTRHVGALTPYPGKNEELEELGKGGEGLRNDFMNLTLKHFSPYVIYDKNDAQQEKKQNSRNNSRADVFSDNSTKSEDNYNNKDNETAANDNNYYIIWILAGASGLAALAALWWLLYKKRKRNENFIAKSLIAEIGNKMKA